MNSFKTLCWKCGKQIPKNEVFGPFLVDESDGARASACLRCATHSFVLDKKRTEAEKMLCVVEVKKENE